MTTITNKVQVAISFDTTGSMYPCLLEVRRKVVQMVDTLARHVPGVELAVIAHGDYVDARVPRSYVTKVLDFTSDAGAIRRFVETVGQTDGGDRQECYEFVLAQAQGLRWRPDYQKSLVMIGDDEPHAATYLLNKDKLAWREELAKLAKLDVQVHAVQCLGNAYAEYFWKELAKQSNGFHLELARFNEIVDLLVGLTFRQSSMEKLLAYEQEVIREGRMSRGISDAYSTMLGRPKLSEADLERVAPDKFRVLTVDEPCEIQAFVEKRGIVFKVGRGFYEFTKYTRIQDHKDIVLRDKATGRFYAGRAARDLLDLPDKGEVGLSPRKIKDKIAKYDVFIQSSSTNRKLVAGTKFLYEAA